MGNRKATPTNVVDLLLALCRRRCCMCYSLERDNKMKNVQIAHIDRDASNNQIGNLAALCLEHHNQYDSVMRQTKNYTPSELQRYKLELETYINVEWNKSMPLNDKISVDIFSGFYSCSSYDREADLDIQYIGGNILKVSGLALYGTETKEAPHTGDLDFVVTLNGTKAVFEVEYDNQLCGIEITFLGDRISVVDNYPFGYFGANVNFNGIYYVTTPKPMQEIKNAIYEPVIEQFKKLFRKK